MYWLQFILVHHKYWHYSYWPTISTAYNTYWYTIHTGIIRTGRQYIPPRSGKCQGPGPLLVIQYVPVCIVASTYDVSVHYVRSSIQLYCTDFPRLGCFVLSWSVLVQPIVILSRVVLVHTICTAYVLYTSMYCRQYIL